SIGLAGGVARSLKSDSIESLSQADSTRYGVVTARLASGASAATPSRLTGLQFSLTALRRVRLGDTTIIVAQLVRRVNQEASPAEERTLIVAEQRGSSEFVAVHSSRSEGTEET